MNIGQRISQLREQRNMSQKDLAKVMGVSQASVGQWENNTRNIPSEKVVKLANYFNVSTDYLLGVPSIETSDLKELLRSGSLSYGGKEISEENIEVISKVVKSFLEE